MDNTIQIGEPGDSKFAILLIPPGTVAPQDFPFEIFSPDDKTPLTSTLEAVLRAIRDQTTIVVPIAGEHAEIFIRLCRAVDVELRALQGMEGDYPSYWLASTSTLPQAVVAEIMLAGTEQTVAVGGDGIQKNKKERTQLKAPDVDDVARRKEGVNLMTESDDDVAD